MAGTRTALLIATDTYTDSTFRQLSAPTRDATALAEVLSDKEIGGFQVRVLPNEKSRKVQLRIEGLFADAGREDFILLYLSGHGVKDQAGQLQLAVTDTRRNRLGTTAIAAEDVRRFIDHSPARKILVWLDCCFAGAFPSARIPKADDSVDILDQLSARSGRGSAVMSASTHNQYAYELDGDAQPSVFTSVIVAGLRTGDADLNDDGEIDADELYRYVEDRVKEITPDQTPTRNNQVTGDLFIALSKRGLRLHSDLPVDIRQNLRGNSRAFRVAAVSELAELASADDTSMRKIAADTLAQLRDGPDQDLAVAVNEAWPSQQHPRQPLRRPKPPRQPRRRLATQPVRDGPDQDLATAAGSTRPSMLIPRKPRPQPGPPRKPPPRPAPPPARAPVGLRLPSRKRLDWKSLWAQIRAMEDSVLWWLLGGVAVFIVVGVALSALWRSFGLPANGWDILPVILGIMAALAVVTFPLYAVILGRVVTLRSSVGLYRKEATFHPQGRFLVCGSIWDTASWVEVGTAGDVAAFHPTGNVMASVGPDGALQRWDTDTRKVLARSPGDKSWVSRLAFSPDGTALVSVEYLRSHVVKIRETKNWRVVQRLDYSLRFALRDLVFSPDGKMLVGLEHSGTVTMWDTGNWQPRFGTVPGRFDSIAFSPAGPMFAGVGRHGTIRLLSTRNWLEFKALRRWSRSTAITFSPDGELLASGCWHHGIKLWNTRTWRRVRTLFGHQGKVTSLAFSPDGAVLASTSEDGTLRLWEIKP